MIKFGNKFESVKGRYLIGNTEYYLVPTICCAIAMIKNVSDYTTTEILKEIIELVKSDTGNHSDGYGQTNLLVISKPGEKQLDKSLKSAGFTMICDTVTRRKCYSEENMKMWIYSF